MYEEKRRWDFLFDLTHLPTRDKRMTRDSCLMTRNFLVFFLTISMLENMFMTFIVIIRTGF